MPPRTISGMPNAQAALTVSRARRSQLNGSGVSVLLRQDFTRM
jgi:hypothetical protein